MASNHTQQPAGIDDVAPPVEAPAKTGPGRPSKGPRDAIITRPDAALGEIIIYFAIRAHLTPGEYMVKLAAEHLGMHQYTPEPMMRTVRVTEPKMRKGLYSLKATPPLEFGAIIKARALEAGLTYGEYLVLLCAEALEMPDSAPRPKDAATKDHLPKE